MKQLAVIIAIAFSTISIYGQEVKTNLKNSIGLSYTSHEYGFVDFFNHSYNLEYRRGLGQSLELRSSIKIGGDDRDRFNALRLGFSDLVWKGKKFSFHLGAELEYQRNRYDGFFDCFFIGGCYVEEKLVNFSSFVGLEYNPLSRLSIRVEQQLVSRTFYRDIEWSFGEEYLYTRFFNGTSVGIYYRW
jgi:hypothetical protein